MAFALSQRASRCSKLSSINEWKIALRIKYRAPWHRIAPSSPAAIFPAERKNAPVDQLRFAACTVSVTRQQPATAGFTHKRNGARGCARDDGKRPLPRPAASLA